MFLQLAHTQLDIYRQSRLLVLEVYKITKQFPMEERYSMCQQLRRAALSVHLNTGEGFSRKSFPERKRFFEISRGYLVEVDTAIGIAIELNYISTDELDHLKALIVNCFRQLSALINTISKVNC